MSGGVLKDNFGRTINYLRLAVTDKCNLRCFYCMPEEGINFLPKTQILTYEEMEYLVKIFASLGVSKVRITGGEPFVKRNIIHLMQRISQLDGISTLNITTNGVLTQKFIPDLKRMGINSVNLSLDTLDKNRFFDITRRDEFSNVMGTLNALLESDINTKLNMVVMDNKNIEDIIPMAQMTVDKPVSVRFIEEMPFNGSTNNAAISWDHKRILEHLSGHFTGIQKIEDPKNSTAYHYQIPGAKGNIGIIAAYTRSFCGSCDRIRLTAQGTMRTCLYSNTGLDLRQLIRDNTSEDDIKEAITNAIQHRHKDGFEAEKHRTKQDSWESMTTIGG